MIFIYAYLADYFYVPFLQKYAKYVGLKRDFRLVVRGAARNMAAILNGSCEILALFVKNTVTHSTYYHLS